MSLGYRFVLNSLSHPSAATAGQQMTLTMAWRNVGVAPTYRNDVLAVQIRNSSGTPVLTSNTGIAVKNWLPGTTYTVTPTVTLPAGLAPGTYTVAIGIVDRATRKPVVQLAIQGRDANGWYPLGTVSVNRGRGDPLSVRLTTGRRQTLASDPAPAGNPRLRPITPARRTGAKALIPSDVARYRTTGPVQGSSLFFDIGRADMDRSDATAAGPPSGGPLHIGILVVPWSSPDGVAGWSPRLRARRSLNSPWLSSYGLTAGIGRIACGG